MTYLEGKRDSGATMVLHLQGGRLLQDTIGAFGEETIRVDDTSGDGVLVLKADIRFIHEAD